MVKNDRIWEVFFSYGIPAKSLIQSQFRQSKCRIGEVRICFFLKIPLKNKISQYSLPFSSKLAAEYTVRLFVQNDQCCILVRCTTIPGPEVIKLIPALLLNSTEHKVSTAHETKISTNKEV